MPFGHQVADSREVWCQFRHHTGLDSGDWCRNWPYAAVPDTSLPYLKKVVSNATPRIAKFTDLLSQQAVYDHACYKTISRQLSGQDKSLFCDFF